MFDWESLRVFIAIAQAGSLSGAARVLKVDHATVSRRLGALEAELQVRLVDRLPRACQLTPLGHQVLKVALEMEANAFTVARIVQAGQSPAAGRVTVSAPPVLASHFLAGQMQRFRQAYPHVQLSVSSQAHSVSLGRREADIALRLYRPTEPDSVTRKLGAMPFALYASRHYEHLYQPEQWAFIAYETHLADMPHQQWLLSVAQGRAIACEVSDIATQHAVVRTGAGVAGLPTFIGDGDPSLQRLPWGGEGFVRDIWLVVHADLRHSPLLRAVMDFMVEVMREPFASPAGKGTLLL
ncbi:LysR family transcriptional regulator [Pseudomonas sp. M47T1]|uniref:LysR family transcriptional regulator n=1 Tax=unclassified Pseudomonas TaxID=196821 RepID=UPI0002607B32|nr:LysR family transcriptional regulator [Pseudomonas sp. M47T1]EIK96223.1 LysR family transcriptional regulator [Pseudomonas sp. M47T1]